MHGLHFLTFTTKASQEALQVSKETWGKHELAWSVNGI